MTDNFGGYEKKYRIPDNTINPVLKDLFNMGYRHCGRYNIKNIYFDTQDNDISRNNNEPSKYKLRIRLRIYDEINEVAFFEIKRRINGLISIRRSAINIHSVYDFLTTRRIPKGEAGINVRVLEELAYFIEIQDLKPSVFIAFERHLYKNKSLPEFNLALDCDIVARDFDLGLEKGTYGKNMSNDDFCTLKIKTSQKYLPLQFLKIMSNYELFPIPFSKCNEFFKWKESNTIAF